MELTFFFEVELDLVNAYEKKMSGLFTSADSLPIQLAPVHGRKNPSDSRLD
jgi:hypothetical protein